MAPSKMEERVAAGRRLSQPPPGDEVVISGVAGYFPDSDSVLELQENLFNKVNLVSSDARRWKVAHREIPQRNGKINHIDKFDAEFFGVHYKEAHTMDPMGRILLEKTYEALIDAGVNPSELKDKKVGVFIGACFSESEKYWAYEKMQVNQFGVTGCSRSMLANRLSQWLGVTGPSYSTDTACSSSHTALEHAFRAIRDGVCESAIVGGANLVLHPYISLLFHRLGTLSSDGYCKSFDESSDGYTRAEAVAVCFLQKAKDSRRAYAQLVYAKANCDGYTEQGITYPSGPMQKVLMEEFYEECSVPPVSVEFIEAHGTGTKVGDPEELRAIDEVFCKGRRTPLLVGSIKTNMGHTEPVSGLCGVVKMCIAYSTGYIPPNLHFKTPRRDVEALTSGRVQVVAEKQPWSRGYSAVSSFGFGGANVHVLLKNYARAKVNNGLPSDSLPRLVCASGRTEAAVARVLGELAARPLDAEQVRLWHAVHDHDIPGHPFRGYTLLRSRSPHAQPIARSVSCCAGARRPLWVVYSGEGAWSSDAALQLMEIPIFAAAVKKCHDALAPLGVNLTKIFSETDSKASASAAHAAAAVAAVQVALTDVLKAVGIEADHFIGHGVGQLVCAYADGCLSAEQTVLAAYYRGYASTEIPKGSAANSNIGYHHPFTNTNGGANIFKKLKDDIPCPKARSKRWVPTSLAQQLWDDDQSDLHSTEVRGNNLESLALFEEAARLIPAAAVAVEVAPHAPLREALARCRGQLAGRVALLRQGQPDGVQTLLAALGQLYEAGWNPRLAEFYPPVQFPVSAGTPMLGHLVEWEHSAEWNVTKYKAQETLKSSERTENVSILEDTSEYMVGHVVDGRNLFPGTGYLVLVWETLGMMMGTMYTELSVVFENVQFLRATNIPKTGQLEFNIAIQGSGNFEMINFRGWVQRLDLPKTLFTELYLIALPSRDIDLDEERLIFTETCTKCRHWEYDDCDTGFYNWREIMESGTSIVTGRIFARKGVGRSYRALPAPGAGAASGGHELLTKDFYKELRLRGYQYSGLFRGVVRCSLDGTRGQLAWLDNWVTFMDSMLQLQVVGHNPRALAVPTRIDRLAIDADVHYQAITRLDPKLNPPTLEVCVYPDAGIIRSGGIEIRGAHAAGITRRVPYEPLVLEKSVFVPNYGNDKMQLVDEEYAKHGYEPVVELVGAVLGDMPLMQAELLVLSARAVALPPHVAVEDQPISSETNTTLFIGASLLSRPDVASQAQSTLKGKSFIMSREQKRPNPTEYADKYDIVNTHNTGLEYMVLFRKKVEAKPTKYVKITSDDDTYSWMELVKRELNEGQKVVLYAQDDNNNINGLLGLINCLRREPGGEVVYGLLIADQSAPPFSPDLPFYAEHLEKDLVHNVYKDGQWGTYRYQLLDVPATVEADHAYLLTATIGVMSSLKWVEGPLKPDTVPKNSDSVLVHVYCAALNFIDVMTASGRVALETAEDSGLAQECTHGLDIAGRTSNGSRVMGLGCMGMSNLVTLRKNVVWPVPDDWTFEEAATVPAVYITVYDALVIKGRVKAGESVLIHAGSGGVGQAAINVALHFGCEVFTTVGTAEKRAFIKKLFPALKDSHIGNSRDPSFEIMIRRATNGRGVDLVLNSLSDEQLQASVRCLAHRGRFVEIGKFDIHNNTPVSSHLASREISFHSTMLDNIEKWGPAIRNRVYDLIVSGIESGAVRPLTHCRFEKHEVESAFRYMAAVKHIGKLVVKIRDEESNDKTAKPGRMRIAAIPRYMCCGESAYVVVGGLGGFGLELADWLVLRGARRLLLAARRPLASGYAAARMRAWAAYGARVQVSAHDAASAAGCEAMLREARAMGPVRAVFNLAVVLKDAVFQNQTPETFRTTFAPKAQITIHLDNLTRKLCPELKDFVMFSSMICGRGNAGQSNYAFANSVVERVCEMRQRDGLPALAVQWGAIGDVGIFANMCEENIKQDLGGMLAQPISSCLVTLDKFLKQDAAIVSSIVVAKTIGSGAGCRSPVEAVAQIVGIRDLKMVSYQMSLAEMGMDSMMAVEIKQTLERDFEIFLTAQDIRTLTFAKLVELSKEREEQSTYAARAAPDGESDFNFIGRDFGDEQFVSEPYIYMPTKVSDSNEEEHTDVENPIIFMLGGTDGVASSLEPLCRGLRCRACVLQLGVEHPGEDLDAMVSRLFLTVRGLLAPGAPFTLLGYSFGCPLMLALAGRLESAGHENGLVFCVDGSPDFNREIVSLKTGATLASQLQDMLLCRVIEIVAPKNNVNLPVLLNELRKLESFEDKTKHAVAITSDLETKYTQKFISQVTRVLYDRMKVIYNFNAKDIKKIQTPIVLIRAKENLPNGVCSQDYGLGVFARGALAVHYVESNHFTILQKEECANIVNEVIFGKVQKAA